MAGCELCSADQTRSDSMCDVRLVMFYCQCLELPGLLQVLPS
jgi:hypothetical protein